MTYRTEGAMIVAGMREEGAMVRGCVPQSPTRRLRLKYRSNGKGRYGERRRRRRRPIDRFDEDDGERLDAAAFFVHRKCCRNCLCHALLFEARSEKRMLNQW